MQFFWHKFLKTLFDQGKEISTYVTDETKTKWQRKILSGNISSVQDIADLQFNNITIGKTYRIGGTMFGIGGNSISIIDFYSGAGGTGQQYGVTGLLENAAGLVYPRFGINTLFVAQSTTLFARANISGGTIFGNGTLAQTNITLEEVPNHEITTDWT